MTKEQYDKMLNFPIEMVTLIPYTSKSGHLKAGATFIGVKKETIGEKDYSIIDSNGHPHYYDGCDPLYKE